MNEQDYTQATYNTYGTDPTLWNGQNPKCELCDKEVEKDDEYCEDHQCCYYCGEREVCIDQGKNCKELE